MKQTFIEKIVDNCINYPDETAAIDSQNGEHLTYGELFHLSGKVYNYLHRNNIGKEDVVMITLPRGIMPIVALFGVWRAGAAVVLLENDYPEAKKEYIRKNAKSKLIVDGTRFNEMMRYDARPGYEKADLHDLAYIVYTSGTTGEPKGVMQEYGTMEYCVKAMPYKGKTLFSAGDRVLLLSPLHFTASIMLIESVLFYCATVVLTPLELTHNLEKLYSVMADYEITVAFFTPSLLRLLSHFPNSVKRIVTGAEPLSNIYYDNLEVYGKYAQSESGYSILCWFADGKYDVAPAGKESIEEAEVCILNDNGEPVQDGEIGEICFKNPYFRGYLGLPEESKALFYNGRIKTGDRGKYLPDGNIVVCGRKDDMIKINGNRVEPAEIEKAVKAALGVDWAAVRSFCEGNRTYICAYYVETPLVDLDIAKEKLRKALASYMVPSYFMRIDRIPVNGNEKFRRNDLPIPDSIGRHGEYVAPVGKTEKWICEAMQQVLNLAAVGACDDFYELGGDSLASVELITLLNRDLLEVGMLYEGRTPRKIAELYTAALKNQRLNLEEENQKALGKEQPLSVEQTYMYDYQCRFPYSTVWNLPVLLKYDGSVDIDRVKYAVDACMKAHPVFSTVYSLDGDGKVVQHYEQNKKFDIRIEEVSEREFVNLSQTLVQPYKLINQPLYRVRLFRTETGGYLFIDMHHSISDGRSLHILIEDISKAYEGTPLAADYYYLNLEERRKDGTSDLLEKGKKYYSEIFDKYEWSTVLNVDTDTGENVYGNLTVGLPIEQQGYEEIHRAFGGGKNAFFIATAVLALHIGNNKENILVSWLHNGRLRSSEQHTIGTLIRTLCVGVHFYNGMKLSDFFKIVCDQITNGILYSQIPPVELNPFCEEKESVSVIYQSDIRTMKAVNELNFTLVDLPNKADAADNYLDIEIHDTEEGSKLYLDYNAAVYKKESIKNFCKLYTKTASCFLEQINNPDISIHNIVERIQNET